VLVASLFCLAVGAVACRLSVASQTTNCTEKLHALGAKTIQSGSVLYGCPFKPIKDTLCVGPPSKPYVSHWMFAVRFDDQTELLTELVPQDIFPLTFWTRFFGSGFNVQNTLFGQMTGLYPYDIRCSSISLPPQSDPKYPDYEIDLVPTRSHTTALDMLKIIEEFRAGVTWPGLYNMFEAWGGVNCQQYAVYMARHITGVDVPSQLGSIWLIFRPVLIPLLWVLSLLISAFTIVIWGIVYSSLGLGVHAIAEKIPGSETAAEKITMWMASMPPLETEDIHAWTDAA